MNNLTIFLIIAIPVIIIARLSWKYLFVRNWKLSLKQGTFITAIHNGEKFIVEIWYINHNPYDKMRDILICKKLNDNSDQKFYIKRKNAKLPDREEYS